MPLCAKEDVFIDRSQKHRVVLMDNDGAFSRPFPSSWSDENILLALEFANQAYEIGRAVGVWEAQTAMRTALGIGVSRDFDFNGARHDSLCVVKT